MKHIFRPLLFALFAIACLQGFAQCTAPSFIFNVGPAGIVTFQDYSFYIDSNMPAPTFTWYFGDGDTSHSGNYYVSHTYASGGTYTASLEIAGSGCDSTISQTVVVNLCAGGAQFNETQTGFGAYSFSPVNLASLSGATVLWNFGGGNTSTSASPSFQFTASGEQAVVLTVTDAALSCSVSDTVPLYVSLCNFNPGIDTTILSYNPESIQFAPSLQNAGYQYNWSFGDGGTANTETATHNYVANGTYTINLSISDATTSCTTSASLIINGNLCGLYEGFYNAGNGFTQSFFASNFDSINGANFNVASYQWSFTGATPATGSAAEADNITFSAAGNYSVCLYATSNGGCVDTVCQTVAVSGPVYNISGVASKSGASGFAGTVYLIVQDSIGHLRLVDSVTTVVDSNLNGFAYNFGGLAVDTYYVKAALLNSDPDYASYLPTYYGDVLNWGTATSIILNAANNSVDISLIEGTNTGGPGFVAGYVSEGAGLIIGNAGNNNAKALGAPIANVQINLLTATNAPVAYTYTDANGHYQFANLALGSYKIYVEQLNKVPSPLDFELTQANPVDSGANMSVNSHSTTGIDNVGNLQILDVYPNPVVTSVQVQISCKQAASATLKLTDILGRTNAEQEVALTSGQNVAELNMEGVAAGVYLLNIQTGGQQITYKIVKAK